MKKNIAAALVGLLLLVGLSACSDTDATVVNENLDTAAENFEINRRITVVNGITDQFLLTAEGRCDVLPKDGRIMLTCKVADGDGPDAYKRHQVYGGDNSIVVVEQIEAVNASAYHYRVVWKPQVVVPDVDFRGSTSEGPTTQD